MPATILLIDDNAVQAATRQTILKRAGYFVIAVLSPERALEQYRNGEFPAPIDLIITDHIMPGMTGAEFVTAVRDFDPEVPVLVISGLAEAEDEYQQLGVSLPPQASAARQPPRQRQSPHRGEDRARHRRLTVSTLPHHPHALLRFRIRG